ncbi:MAG: hypothetical protein KAG56_11415 [Sulfurovaceae bacterium]|nr:hypothetical protein [Sulfurovaceae bacterium]
MLKKNIIIYKSFLVILASISVASADQINKKAICYTTHEEKASSLFSEPQPTLVSFTEQDINNDGKNEIIYHGNCGVRLCDSIVLAKINGCYLDIFGIQGDIGFLDEVPKNIKSTKLFKLSKASLDLKYKPISAFTSHCAGATRNSSVYLFNKEKNEYVGVYSQSFDFCGL